METGLKASFVAAAWGVLNTVATQRNMKIHIASAVMVMIVGMALPLGLAAKVALMFCVALVFFAEILNTALEAFVDLHIQEYARLAMVAKDAAAAGVLVLSVATVLVLGDILWTDWGVVEANTRAVQRSVLYGVPLTLVEAALLWGPCKVWYRLILGAVAVALALPLWQHSQDLIFSITLAGLVVLALASRQRPSPQGPGPCIAGAEETSHNDPAPV